MKYPCLIKHRITTVWTLNAWVVNYKITPKKKSALLTGYEESKVSEIKLVEK